MSTYMPKKGDITRDWYVIDAAGKPLGRVAAKAAELLNGKHKVIYTPHADCGDCVIIINAEKAILTGNKYEGKHYYHHTGYIGNMKGMLPDTTIGRNSLTRLRVYRGSEHNNAAQKPVSVEI